MLVLLLQHWMEKSLEATSVTIVGARSQGDHLLIDQQYCCNKFHLTVSCVMCCMTMFISSVNMFLSGKLGSGFIREYLECCQLHLKEIIWMIGIYVQLVWNIVICKTKTLKLGIHCWSSRLEFLNLFSDKTVIRIYEIKYKTAPKRHFSFLNFPLLDPF